MKKKIDKNKKSSGVKASASADAKSNVVANARLVAAIKASDQAMLQATTVLVTVGEIAQAEDLTRAEVVASLMEARGITKSTAETQYSRMKKLFTDPETLAKLKSGEITLKAAREATEKKQKNPSEEAGKKAKEKRLVKALGTVVETAKEMGMEFTSVVKMLKVALKKAGVKP